MKNDFKNKINIAYAPDNKFAHLAIVSMISLLENTKENVNIFVDIYILFFDCFNKTFCGAGGR